MLLLLDQERTNFFIKFRDPARIDGEARNGDGRKPPVRVRGGGDILIILKQDYFVIFHCNFESSLT